MRLMLRLSLLAFLVPFMVVGQVIAAARDFAFSVMPDFQPVGMESVALDRVSHELSAESARSTASRYTAFVDRARSHARYIGDAFRIDPGRAFA